MTSHADAGGAAALQVALQSATQVAFEVATEFLERRVIPFTKIVSQDEILASPPTDCSICLCNVEASCDDHQNTVLKVGCGHMFHRDCIAQWFRRDLSCPTCRWQCKKMRHMKVKAAVPSDEDGWSDYATASFFDDLFTPAVFQQQQNPLRSQPHDRDPFSY
jgi:hypothetical protein